MNDIAEAENSDISLDAADTIKRYKVIDCYISATDSAQLICAIEERITNKKGGYVCFSNAHTVVTSHHDKILRDITNESFVSAADGKPLSVVGQLMGVEGAHQVAGPDFMAHLLEHGQGIRHFFFGSTPETLEALVGNVKAKYINANVVGSYSPPFKPVSIDQIDEESVKIIKQAEPDIIWVGLGAPKQEYWMCAHEKVLAPSILMGVGAAFDFHAGCISRAPQWVRKMGFEWLHRLLQEPRRLFKRYAVTNSLFLYYVIKGIVFNKIFGSSSGDGKFR